MADNVQRGIGGRADKSVARSVDTDGINEIVEGNYSARTLRHAHSLTIFKQIDHLANEHFDGVRVIT